MKVFGKKTLSLLLAIAMVLSVCSVTAFAGSTNKGTKTLVLGKEAEVTLSSGLTVTEGQTKIEWASDKADVAAVDQSGKVTAAKVGTGVTISATVAAIGEGVAGEGKSAVGEKETWTVNVENSVKSIVKTLGEETLSVPFGAKESDIVNKIKQNKYTITYSDSTANAEEIVSFAEWECDKTYTGKNGTYTFTAKKSDMKLAKGVTFPKVTVTVQKGVINGVTPATRAVEVPLGTNVTAAAAELNKKYPTVQLTLNGAAPENGIAGAPSYDAKVTWSASAYKNDAEGTLNTFTAALQEGALFSGEFTAPTATVKVTGAKNIPLNSKTIANSEGAVVKLDEVKKEIRKAINAITAGDIADTDDITFSAPSYGKIVENLYILKEQTISKGEYKAESLSFEYTGKVSGVKYKGTLTIKIYSTQLGEMKYDISGSGETLSKFASELNTKVYDLYKTGLSKIYISDIYSAHNREIGGVLFTSASAEEEVVSEEMYTKDNLASMFYQPDGTGNVTYVSFTAYAGDSQKVYGELALTSDAYLVLTGKTTTKETIPLEAATFEKALLEWGELDNDDYDYALDYVKFRTSGSSSSGYLYYEYDDSESKNERISTSTKYYANPDSRDKDLSLITYVPDERTEGTITFEFTAYYDKTRGSKEYHDSISGVIRIDVTKPADIVISTAVDSSVDLDIHAFEEFLDDNKVKFSEIAYITFDNAPYSKREGYLYDGDSKIRTPDSKKFYVSDDKYGDIDFNNVVFVADKYEGEHRATFKVYYKYSSSSSSTRSKEGTIDFVIGKSSGTTFTGIYASQQMTMSPSAFLTEGYGTKDQPNQYVTFTSLPVGGKLWYNYGKPGQTEVVLNRAYVLGVSPMANNYLGNVTFVPSYTAAKGGTINVEIKTNLYVSNSKYAPFTVKFPVYSLTSSQKFTDVGSNYSWCADSVDFLSNRGITQGVGGAKFAPDQSLSRAEFVAFMYRAAGSPAVTNVKNPFKDVKKTNDSAFYYDAVLWANQNGITTGTGNGKFEPMRKVTHQELLTFLYRYDVNYMRHSASSSPLYSFSDAGQLASWAKPAAEWAAFKGVLTGTTIQPTVTANRGTMALWLHRMLTL